MGILKLVLGIAAIVFGILAILSVSVLGLPPAGVAGASGACAGGCALL